MAASSQSQDQLTGRRAADEELEVLENGGLSPQLSVRTTEDDACSEIIRIEQQDAQEEKDGTSTMGRIVRSLQVGLSLSLSAGIPLDSFHSLSHSP